MTQKTAFGFGAVLGGLSGANKISGEVKALTGIGSLADLANKFKSMTPTGKALATARRARAVTDPVTARVLEMSQNLNALGISTSDAANLAKTYQTGLQAQVAAEQLKQSKTLIGRLNQSTMGQLTTPLVAMGLVTGGGLAGQQAFNVLGASGINVDPSARLASGFGVKRVLEAKPELKQYPSDRIRHFYEVIFTTAPSITKDPLATANLIQRMINMGGDDQNVRKELAEYEKVRKDPSRFNADLFSLGSNLMNRR